MGVGDDGLPHLHKIPLLSSATELFFLGTRVALRKSNVGGALPAN
jgi:hypothetical protein